jgi:hypothetical protein
VKITRRSSLRAVALAAGRALAEHGIRAVLTGGACASLHADGAYVSEDVDFVLEGRVRVGELDEALAGIGFRRVTNRYVHPDSPFWLEFPRGPLAVGGDLDVEPVKLRGAGTGVLALSATDSCRDRLAAFYHWNDRQSLEAALEIALRNRIELERVRRWSAAEGQEAKFDEFALRLRRRRSARARRAAKRP